MSSALQASAFLAQRVRRPALLQKLCSVEDVIPHFKDGMYLGWSGFTGVGYPKMTPVALADHVENNNLAGKMRFNVFVGASTGAETEDRWARLDMVDRRYPHQVGKNIAKGINEGRIRFADKHLSMFPQDLVYGYYSRDKPGGAMHVDPAAPRLPTPERLPRERPIDIAIVEATAITEDCEIIPGASVGATPELVRAAEKVIIEVNTAIPSFEGLHDIVTEPLPPYRDPINITSPEDRVGTLGIPVDPDRIVAIIESDRPDNTGPNAPQDEASKQIAGHLIDFLEHEVKVGRLPPKLSPLQSGIGNIANAVIGGLADAPFANVTVYTEVIQDTFLDFFAAGKLDFASATSIRFSPEGFERFYQDWEDLKGRLLLRPQSISNSPEVIRRIGCIAMNTPVEFDIYGHANSTCVMGSKMLNGLGGSGDFLRNSRLSIMHSPSVRPKGKDPTAITCLVPMCSHVDQTEHDLDVIVTEQGLADLRGLCPRDRAQEIIQKCAHPVYKPLLEEYYRLALDRCLKKGAAHEPHMLDKAFKMFLNLEEKGTMLIDSW
uniref:Acetyl-CoA hydrolase n=1 Tax=Chromera velia CCMP2878 TaxID=1169474 RepID=A0A0G4GE14_9ALVE|eukprot:Cvel_21452.t1-p1 / transcript=Cvel_21452.t1 / gene=Cvel_21452 / organism=Chromera_velia_CCMP2878 / gene_product=Acetyl-CoA hydrolase, putative / transcript_product=Acetyl-CoA hydrolase, putative / location=Cvel_scaffold2013:1649-7966(-) / protein_length=547 / sequence_SO=supercontig / SO=protein_coding / is_pseudo=false